MFFYVWYLNSLDGLEFFQVLDVLPMMFVVMMLQPLLGGRTGTAQVARDAELDVRSNNVISASIDASEFLVTQQTASWFQTQMLDFMMMAQKRLIHESFATSRANSFFLSVMASFHVAQQSPLGP